MNRAVFARATFIRSLALFERQRAGTTKDAGDLDGFGLEGLRQDVILLAMQRGMLSLYLWQDNHFQDRRVDLIDEYPTKEREAMTPGQQTNSQLLARFVRRAIGLKGRDAAPVLAL